MRTTIKIDDELLARAKARAAERGTTLSDVVQDALREAFLRPVASVAELPPLPVFHGDGLQPGVDLADGGSIWDLQDEDGGWRDRG